MENLAIGWLLIDVHNNVRINIKKSKQMDVHKALKAVGLWRAVKVSSSATILAGKSQRI